MNEVVIGVIGFSFGCGLLWHMIQVARLRNVILLHWTYMKSLEVSLDTLKAAIEAVDGKVDKLSESLDATDIRLDSVEMAVDCIDSSVDKLTEIISDDEGDAVYGSP